MLAQDRAAVWRARLRRQPRSGLTVVEFCQREGVSVPSFYQWRRRLAETVPAVPAFQQVMLAGGPVVNIAWPNGVRMELPAHQGSLIQAVVAELGRSAASTAGDV